MSEPQTSWNNHYKIGYNGGNWFGRRQTNQDELSIQIDGCGRMPAPVAVEAVWAAQAMIGKYGADNITLLYSGGCDSEIILQSFVGNGIIPGRVLFLNYGEGMNDYDRAWATRFCKFNGIKLEEMAIPATEILQSGEALELCEKYQCAQSGAALYLYAMERLCKDSYVVAGDEPYLELFNNPLDGTSEWSFVAREWTFSQWKVFHYNGVDGCPNFLQWTAELWAAFLLDPILQWCVSQTAYTTTNQIKYDLYQQRFFVRKRHKSTGMEKFGHLIHDLNARLHLAKPLIENAEFHHPYQHLIGDLMKHVAPTTTLG